MSPGDRANLARSDEPLSGLQPVRTDSMTGGGGQPVSAPFRLEEEPALWPTWFGHLPRDRSDRAP